MTNTKSTKRALLTSVLALFLCFTMLLGTTFAWFTDSVTSANNIIKAGNLDIELYHSDKAVTDEKVGENTKLFDEVALWEPGAVVYETLEVVNEGDLALKYQLAVNVTNATANANGNTLSNILKVGVIEGGATITDRVTLIGAVDEWMSLSSFVEAGDLVNKNESDIYTVVIYWEPSEYDNDYNMNNGKGAPLTLDIGVTLFATQLMAEEDAFGKDYDENAEIDTPADEWDGSASIEWFLANPNATTFTLSSAEDIAGLAELVNGTADIPSTIADEISGFDFSFEGKEIILTSDVNLYLEDTSAAADGDPVTFRPIGDVSGEEAFEGVFDGNGHTIYNLYQNGWDLGYEWGAYGSYGLFGQLNNATVKNLTLSGGESYIEGGDVSFVAGSATGTCVFENITIENSIAATYNNGCGGIIGWSGEGDYTFKNITIADDCVLGGLWGSFDSSIGGIVGQAEPGATYNFENVNVACKIDAYNDCTASYDYYNYRMCGMLIGRLKETTTIDGSNYPDTSKYNITCKDVTVTYGDWANYHYCRAEGARAKRVEAGYAYDGIAADYDHSVCTAHHMELIAFDQIFGGDQYAVKGLKTYEGVNVIYNNK